MKTRASVLRRRGGRTQFAALVLTTTLIAAACAPGSTDDADADETSDTGPDLEGEAPMLAERVSAGDLPEVDERLPQNPLVVEPHERIGQYGGTWRTAINGPDDVAWFLRTIGYEGLVRWAPDWTGAAGDAEIIPNIAESYEASSDATEYTFTLREGMRWSDGEPFTVEDIEFAFHEIAMNPELDAIPAAFLVDGEPADLRVEDDLTFTVTFPEPSGLFLALLAEGPNQVIFPKHYLEQFHPDYADDIDEVVASEGYSHWAELMVAKMSNWTHTELPRLHPWVITQALGDGNAVIAERNPYYWKVDTEGNQLPYIDQVRYDMMNEDEVILAAAMQGDLDMHVRHINTPVNRPVLASAREDAEFEFLELIPGLANELVINLNLTHEDEVMREIFTNKDFRIGLSHAIDREELVNSVYQRQGTPSQVSPQPESPFYNEQLATQYTEYDVDLANQHLDEAGYDERDAQGRRLGPDGQPIRFTVDHAGQPGFDDALALIATNWSEVGITMTPDVMDRSLYEERRVGNTPDASVWLAGGGTDVIQNPHAYLPIHTRADYAQQWVEWYRTGGDSGSEPPEGTQRQYELYDELQRTADAAEQESLMAEILQIAADEFYHIGTVLPGPGYGIVRNNFHNVPSQIAESVRIQTPALTNPEQYFISGD